MYLSGKFTVIKRVAKVILFILLLPVFYIALILIIGTLQDFQPEEKINITVDNPQDSTIDMDSTLSFLIWNIGYAGLGKDSEFFIDAGNFYTSGGKTVNQPKAKVEKYFVGIQDFFRKNKYDFIMLQEVDKAAERSHKINQYEDIASILNTHSSTYSINYWSNRVPVPLFEPWNIIGNVESGLATYSKYTPSEAFRYQLPGSYPWPDRIFHLDRCAAFSYFDLPNGKQLVVINIHNSAYDKGGILKKQQLSYLKNRMTEEYKKGNYIVAGGDWNQGPLGIEDDKAYNQNKSLTRTKSNVPKDFFPDWTYAYDANVATNRSARTIFRKNKTRISIIDFYLLSPNLELVSTTGINQDFSYSDHQPVEMKIKLK